MKSSQQHQEQKTNLRIEPAAEMNKHISIWTILARLQKVNMLSH